MGGSASITKALPISKSSEKYLVGGQLLQTNEAGLGKDLQLSKKSECSNESTTVVAKFSFIGSSKSVAKSENRLEIIDVEKDASTPDVSSNVLLSPDPSCTNPKVANYNVLSQFSASKELLIKNRTARKLFARFIKESPLKWLEQFAFLVQQKGNTEVLSGNFPSRSVSISPMASPTNRSSQLSSNVLSFHSYSVSKPMTSQSLSPEDRMSLDITTIMKQMKIKDSLEATALLASHSNSNDDDSDDNRTVNRHLTPETSSNKLAVKKSPLSKIFSQEVLESYFFLAMIPIFETSPQYQSMKANGWREDLLDKISFASNGGGSPSRNHSATVDCMQEFRISSIIQYSRSQLKNDPLANIQQLFYSLSRDLTESDIERRLSSSDWLESVLSSLVSCPIGVGINKNIHAVDFQEKDSMDEEEDDDIPPTCSYLQEKLPIVFSNSVLSAMTGYSKEELLGRNFSSLLPKADQKMVQFPKNDRYNHNDGNNSGLSLYYNDRRLVRRFLDHNQQGERVKVGLIQEKRNGEKYYDFIATSPIYNPRDQQYHYLISLHLDLSNDQAKLSDFKTVDELLCLMQILFK